MQFVKEHARFFVAGLALLIAFGLSIRYSDRGWQFDLDQGGRDALASPEPGKASDYNLSGAEILNKVLLQMKEKYVDPTRVDPNRMLLYGLDEVQNSIPEVVIRFDRDIEDNPTTATVQAGNASKTFRIGGLESIWEMSFKMKEIFRFLQDNLEPNDDLKFNEVEYAAINGMLNTLDPHSVLLNPKVYMEMQTQTGGKFGGLGIVIGIRDGFLTVISPMDDTPAARAGIKSRDRIMRIEDESTINMSLSDAVSKLRGEPGTKVTIWVQRKGWADPKPISLERAEIKIASVESHLLSSKVGYVKIKSFQANTYSGLRKHLDELATKSGGLSGLVLDLRNNPGGLLDQAIKVSDAFLETGTIVSTVGYGNRLRDENKATRRNTQPQYPIIVLVDPGSASASEIVSGALKNHNRAVIVGDTTFGKGSVQVIYELSDGSALKLTIAQYLTPGDISIQSVGIVPDIQLQPVTVGKEEVDLFSSDRITREADLESHLDHSNVKRGDRPASIVRYLQPPEPDFDADNPPEEEGFKEDFAIRFAQSLLKSADRTYQRPNMLKKIEPALKTMSEQEMAKVTAELSKQNIDWSAGKSDPSPSVSVTLTSDQPNHTFKAGDTITFKATVANRGDQPLYRVRAVSRCDNELFDDREFLFGKLKPGETISRMVTVEVPKHHGGRFDVVKLDLGAMNTDLSDNPELTVRTTSKARPHFAFSYTIDDSQKGNGDGVLQDGESATLHLNVVNNGDGDSGKTTAYLRNLSGSNLYLKTGRAESETIQAGGQQSFSFTFDVSSVPKGEPLKAEIEIYDEIYREFTSEKIDLLAEPKAVTKVKRSNGSITLNKDGAIRLAARPDAMAIAQVKPGTRLKVTAAAGDMLRVKLAKNIFGWVNADQGTVSKAQAAAAVDYKPVVLRTSPVIRMKESTAITSKAVYRLNGVASDNANIRDYYVFVHTQKDNKIKTRKVAYKAGGDNTLKLDADIPLKQGMNRIRLYVRDQDDMVASETVYVYRR
ncbi:MAG: MXAN_5808 family serine peptidase [Myxococcota bacterium]